MVPLVCRPTVQLSRIFRTIQLARLFRSVPITTRTGSSAQNTVYYLLPGTHVGSFSANTNDAFIGGRFGSTSTILSGDYRGYPWGIDSNSSDGDQSGVSIEYLTIEEYQPPVDQSAINQDSNSGWVLQDNTIMLNVPGAGVMLGAENTLKDNCMTQNGQYGFQSSGSWTPDRLTGGPYNLNVEGNEISYNDTCDLEGTITNSAAGLHNHNPVPMQYQNSHCGSVTGDGNQGGFKLWTTNGVTIAGNYIHNNYGPGGWADTDNANTTWTGNTITDNDGQAIIEEISYNFAITDNYIANNDWIGGLANSEFPQPAIYISESGSDTQFGGVPACSEASCSDQRSYSNRSIISNNELVDNGGNIFLWQDSGRYCSDGSDGPCTLVDGSFSEPFTVSRCAANWPTAAINTTTYAGETTGSPPEDYWDGCMWKTENVSITDNTIDFNPANIPDCNQTAWPDCGVGGIFSNYGSPPNNVVGGVIPTDITFFQHNVWSDNTYNGPSKFYAWNQGNGPISWADWTGKVSDGDYCGMRAGGPGNEGGGCSGPFGQDSGSTYNATPLSGTPYPSTSNKVTATTGSPTRVTASFGQAQTAGDWVCAATTSHGVTSQVGSVGASSTTGRRSATTSTSTTWWAPTGSCLRTTAPPGGSSTWAAALWSRRRYSLTSPGASTALISQAR